MAVWQPAASIVTMAPRHQAVEQAGEGRDFVALILSFHLAQNQMVSSGPRVDQVDGLILGGTPERFAVNGNQLVAIAAVVSEWVNHDIERPTAQGAIGAGSRHRVSRDMELPAHRQCGGQAADRIRLPPNRHRSFMLCTPVELLPVERQDDD